MSVKITKSEAYNLNNTTICLGNSFEGQFLVNWLTPKFYNAGTQWNFDVYEYKDTTLIYGNEFPSKNFSSKIMKECANEMRNVKCISGEEDKAKREEILDKFIDSVNRGIHDPSQILNFNQYKKNLYEQHQMFPEKSLLEIGKELTDYIPNIVPTKGGWAWGKSDAKQKVTDGLQKYIEKVYSEKKSSEEFMEEALKNVLEDYTKKLEKSNSKKVEETRSR